MAIQFLNNVNADSGVLYVDAVNDKVGIGTTSPANKLDVAGNIGINNSIPKILFTDTDTSTTAQISANSSNLTYTTVSTARDHIFKAGTSTLMTIEGTGNVGIGTTSPITKLTINDSNTAGESQLAIGDTTSYHLAMGHNSAGNTDGFIGTVYDNDAARFDIRMKGTAQSDAKVTVLGTGNVGIGTTSPSAKLHVAGEVRVDPGDAFMFDVSNNIYAVAAQNQFRLYSGGNPVINVPTSGNVGIGTTSPSQKLHVDGNIRVTGAYYDSSNSAGTSGKVLSSTGSATSWVDGSGLPGGPYLPLTGGTMTGVTRHGDSVYSYWGTGDDLVIYHDGTDSYLLNGTGDLEIVNNTDDGDIIFKSDNGSGGTTPYLKLWGAIESLAVYKDMLFVNDGDGGKLKFGASQDLQIYHDGNNSYIADTSGAGGLRINTNQFRVYNANGTELMINANENSDVELYYDNSKKLETTSAGVTVTGNVNATSFVGNAAIVNQVTAATSGGDIDFKNNAGSDKMRITDSGNVGIGTTSPSRALQVVGTDGAAKFYYNSSFTNSQYSVVDIGMMTSGTAANGFGPKITFRMGGNGFDGFTAGFIGTLRNGADNTHNMNFATSNGGSLTTKMTITNSGDVGIGTTSPSEKLDVDGIINLTGLKISGAQGSDGQVLTSTGSGIAWEDVSGGLPTTGGTMTGDLKFNDNVYARFGSTGTGDLIIGHVDFGSPYSTILENGSGDLKIQATNLLLESANGETYIDCNFNSSVDLYYNNSKKFETTNTGVSTTGDSIITGDVGIGTTSPSAKLHVNGQNGLIVGDGNETGLSINNGTYIYKIGDIDGGENQSFIEIDSASQKTIFNNTNVGIGTSQPSSLVEMSATLDNTSSKLLRLTRSNQGSSPAKAVGFYSNSGERGSITVSNFATAYNTSSDYRLKENVVPIEDGINRLMSLKPCRFNFISEEQVVDGFLAHEAQNIVPEAISGEKDQIDEDGNEVYQGIDQAKLVPLLTAALQEAIKRIEILEQKK